MPETTPYGSWPSPITAASLVEGAVGISEVCVDGDTVYWAEVRPSEAGRTAIVRRRIDGSVTEVTPPGANVRTRVHEYGGGAWWAHRGELYYSDYADQRLRRLLPGAEPMLLTDEPTLPAGDRFADGRVTPDGMWYVCVREHHHAEGEPTNSIVAVATDGSGQVEELVSGADFYSSPRVSPDGRRLAWVQWQHPDMPWDATELWTGSLDGPSITDARCEGGADGGESIVQPEWTPDGRLWWLSDADGNWNLFEQGEQITMGPEIGYPHWVFGESRFDFLSNGGAVFAVGDADGDRVVPAAFDIDRISTVTALRSWRDGAVFVAGSHDRNVEVVEVRPGRSPEVLQAAVRHGLDPAFLPEPEHITFPTGPSGTDAVVAHGIFYPPANPSHVGPADERPPLLVLAHGGPTSAARNQLQLALRYWTSRGWAVVDVDYRGSVGYGREFRSALDGQWGIADVEDCVAAARYLAERGDVDGDRLAIRGGSAGGFTVLAALAFHDAFAVGASRYGVADLEALASDTHKFESRYLDRLVGPYPEAKALYVERSPLHSVDAIDCPMIVLQGQEDEVVPPNQAELIVAALAAKGLDHEYVLFDDEGHGFRKAENIVRALEAEEAFFARTLGLTAR